MKSLRYNNLIIIKLIFFTLNNYKVIIENDLRNINFIDIIYFVQVINNIVTIRQLMSTKDESIQKLLKSDKAILENYTYDILVIKIFQNILMQNL